MKAQSQGHPRSREPHEELAWICLLGLAAMSFGVGWFADTLIALF